MPSDQCYAFCRRAAATVVSEPPIASPTARDPGERNPHPAAGDPTLATDLARQDALLPHLSDFCQAASAAFATAIAVGVAGGGAEPMWQGAHDNAGEEPEAVRLRLDSARAAPPRDFQHQMRWVLTALQNTFNRRICGTLLEEAVIVTVSYGGDTDTNAAVCSALLGALQGHKAVPLQWRNAVLTCRPVSALPSNAHLTITKRHMCCLREPSNRLGWKTRS